LSSSNQNLSDIGRNLVVYAVLFEVSLLAICFVIANLKLIECTMCDEGELIWEQVH